MTIKLLTTPTCIPCKVLAKRLDDFGIEYIKLNALEHPEYNVKSTPHIIVEKDGEILKNEHVKSIPEMISYLKTL